MIYSNLVNFDYQLCYMCLKRNFPTFKHYFKINNINCFICKGIFSKINEMVQKMFEMIHFEENYSYRSFTIGTTLPYYMFDIEDSIRSHYKLKGIEDIKSSFNFKIRNNFKSLSKKKLNIINPDIKINLSISDNNDYSIKVLSRSLYLLGRYNKKKFMAQREKNVLKNNPNNNQDSIITKNQTIQTIIQKILSDCIRSDRMVFSWYGSEDDNSQVLGKGRLFLVQLINPRKRTIKMNKVFTRNGISFKIIEKKDYLENVKRNFRIKNKIFIKTSNPINKIYFINLMKLNNSIIRYQYKSKIFSKKIYRIGFKKLDPYHLIIHLECDSGLFLRQFIEGRNFITPNISLALQNQCECLKFDIMDISLS
jgi:tRNA pseudouridine synthase 10